MKYYPVALSHKDHSSLIAGGGNVAERKALNLLRSGSRVKIVSPAITPKLKRLVKRGKVKWIPRRFKKSDLSGSELIIAATNDPNVNNKVSLWAKEKRILVNVVDKPALSTFISPAILRRGKTIIAVYTDGRDPILSRDLKNYIKENWDGFLSYRHRL